jgi:sulfate permease, SulP family
VPGLLIFRFAGPLFFFNATHFARRVHELIDTADPSITFFLINAEAIVDVDMTGVEVLRELHDTLKSKNITLGLCDVKGHFREALSSMTRLADFIVYPSVPAALRELTKEKPKQEKKSGASDEQVRAR